VAGSTQDQLVTLFEDLILGSERLGTTSDPTEALITTFINKAIREIANSIEPQELLDSAATTANISANTNTVTIPTTYIRPTHVYYKTASGSYFEVFPRGLKSLIDSVGPTQFYDTARTGIPKNFAVRGDKLVFDKHFDRTESNAVSMFGINTPTILTIASPSATTELPIDYDMLIMYKTAAYFYKREEDMALMNKYEGKADIEENRVRVALKPIDRFSRIELDTRFFVNHRTGNINNSDVLFS